MGNKSDLIENQDHLRFIASLPCLVTGMEGDDIHAHHLLRGTGEKAMGQKSGDNWAIPLHYTVHNALHGSPLGETSFLAQHGVRNAPAIALGLYTATGDYDTARAMIVEAFEKNWKLRAAGLKIA